jgi:A/G-specific adenine glycosylase
MVALTTTAGRHPLVTPVVSLTEAETVLGPDRYAAVSARAGAVAERLLEWGTTHRRCYPWREPPRSPYTVLVAELLLKRTTATAASRVYPLFLAKYPTVGELAQAELGELQRVLSCVGLQRQRADAFQAAALHIIRHEGGEIPCDLNRLLCIPHVGAYTACAVLSFAYGMPAPVVDSNFTRFITRVFAGLFESGIRPKEVWAAARIVLPDREHVGFNYAVLDFAGLVCRYGQPRCGDCVISELCDRYRSLL